jgi:hypothetical protein
MTGAGILKTAKALGVGTGKVHRVKRIPFIPLRLSSDRCRRISNNILWGISYSRNGPKTVTPDAAGCLAREGVDRTKEPSLMKNW